MGERIAAKWRWRTVARMATAGTVAFGLCPGLASAGATLQVGPGKPYTKVSDAVAAAAAGDVIEVDPGDYVDDFSIIKQGDLTIRGVGGRPHLHAASPVPNKKGIFVVDIDAAWWSRTSSSRAPRSPSKTATTAPASACRARP